MGWRGETTCSRIVAGARHASNACSTHSPPMDPWAQRTSRHFPGAKEEARQRRVENSARMAQRMGASHLHGRKLPPEARHSAEES